MVAQHDCIWHIYLYGPHGGAGSAKSHWAASCAAQWSWQCKSKGRNTGAARHQSAPCAPHQARNCAQRPQLASRTTTAEHARQPAQHPARACAGSLKRQPKLLAPRLQGLACRWTATSHRCRSCAPTSWRGAAAGRPKTLPSRPAVGPSSGGAGQPAGTLNTSTADAWVHCVAWPGSADKQPVEAPACSQADHLEQLRLCASAQV